MFARPIRLIQISIFFICACSFTSIAIPVDAYAHITTDPITIVSQTDTISFPKGIDFQLTAQDSNSVINQAIIYLSFDLTVGYTQQHEITPDSAMNTVTLRWHEDTSSNDFTPPGTQVSYYWELHDNAGHVYAAPKETFTVTDTRFNWQHLSQGLLQVNWYNRPGSFGQTILNQASANIQRISENLGGNLQQQINLWIYQNISDFHGSLPPDVHEWVGGIAFPRLSQASIVIRDMSDDTLSRDMPHELTHLIFHQLIAKDVQAPIWFDEGLAVYNQIYHEPGMPLRFEQALSQHTLLSIYPLSTEFPSDADQAFLAYAQSWKLVSYMYSTYGQARMDKLIKDMGKANTDFDQDLTDALGIDEEHLENNWHLSLGQPATLSSAQMTPTPQATATAATVVPTTNNNESVLVLLGLLILLLSAGGMGGLFFFQYRSRERTAIRQQAEQIIHSTLPTTYTRPQEPANEE